MPPAAGALIAAPRPDPRVSVAIRPRPAGHGSVPTPPSAALAPMCRRAKLRRLRRLVPLQSPYPGRPANVAACKGRNASLMLVRASRSVPVLSARSFPLRPPAEEPSRRRITGRAAGPAGPAQTPTAPRLPRVLRALLRRRPGLTERRRLAATSHEPEGPLIPQRPPLARIPTASSARRWTRSSALRPASCDHRRCGRLQPYRTEGPVADAFAGRSGVSRASPCSCHRGLQADPSSQQGHLRGGGPVAGAEREREVLARPRGDRGICPRLRRDPPTDTTLLVRQERTAAPTEPRSRCCSAAVLQALRLWRPNADAGPTPDAALVGRDRADYIPTPRARPRTSAYEHVRTERDARRSRS